MTNRIESFFAAPNTESAYKGDYTKATIYQYLHLDANTRSGILESYKKPLENRVCSASVQYLNPIFSLAIAEKFEGVAGPRLQV